MLRRNFLVAMVLAAAGVAIARAKVIFGGAPWSKDPVLMPEPVVADGWKFFTAPELAAVNAIADRLIPHDDLSIGGSEAGCALFIDRQLVGDFGQGVARYKLGPVVAGTPQQGPQFIETPAERYRIGLAALDAHCAASFGGKAFAALAPAQQDQVLTDLEAGHISVGKLDPRAFFNLLLQNVREGYFADPIYGGNKDMASWKWLGFPGAQYDFRDQIGQRGKDLKIIPISLLGKKA